MISHYYLQRAELRNDRHAQTAESYAMSKGVNFSAGMADAVADIKLGEVEAAATSRYTSSSGRDAALSRGQKAPMSRAGAPAEPPPIPLLVSTSVED